MKMRFGQDWRLARGMIVAGALLSPGWALAQSSVQLSVPVPSVTVAPNGSVAPRIAIPPVVERAKSLAAEVKAAVPLTEAELKAAAEFKAVSATNSAKRATTYKLGNGLVNVVGLAYATGSLFDSVAMSVISGGIGWGLFIAVDYVWDTYYPAPVKVSADQSFDVAAQSWRNTLKYFTYKPLALSEKWAVIYFYTGSAALTATWGTGLAAINSVYFFVNGMAWDYYEFQTNPPVTTLAKAP